MKKTNFKKRTIAKLSKAESSEVVGGADTLYRTHLIDILKIEAERPTILGKE